MFPFGKQTVPPKPVPPNQGALAQAKIAAIKAKSAPGMGRVPEVVVKVNNAALVKKKIAKILALKNANLSPDGWPIDRS
jgi:hypothetical protein